jgi:peroxiredoxin
MVESGTRSFQRGQVIPDFTLDDIYGETVSSRVFYMRQNLIIALIPKEASDEWKEWLTTLSAAVQSIPERDAVCLMIFPPEWRATISNLYSNGNQIKLLIDHEGTVASRFDQSITAGEGQLLITDRYGVIFHAATGEPSTPGLSAAEVPEWIELITCRCS